MSDQHSQPDDDAECAACMEDLTEENYAEYRPTEEAAWLPSPYCKDCIETMLRRKWEDYQNNIKTTKCAAEWRRLLEKGPPINLRDSKALPCPDDSEVHSLWYMADPEQIHSAKLHGSLEGDARKEYWDFLLQFQPTATSAKEGEDEDEEVEEGG